MRRWSDAMNTQCLKPLWALVKLAGAGGLLPSNGPQDVFVPSPGPRGVSGFPLHILPLQRKGSGREFVAPNLRLTPVGAIAHSRTRIGIIAN